jgi:Fur family transcriptional regulator, ferric uptake regulator
MKKAIDTLRGYLRANDLKLTKQRRIALDAVLGLHSHFTAEELIGHLDHLGTRVSKATVYRTLNLLVDSGHLETRDFGRGAMLYEHVHGHTHHDHIVCLGCGTIVEFRNAQIEEIQKRVAQRKGFRIDSHVRKMYGWCRDCRR